MSPVDFKWQRNEPRVVQTIIYVEPVAKGRPRSTVIAGHVHSYTPAKTRNAEAMIQAMIRTKARELGRFDAGVPIRLEATFYRERPKHLPKRVTMPVSRPDSRICCFTCMRSRAVTCPWSEHTNIWQRSRSDALRHTSSTRPNRTPIWASLSVGRNRAVNGQRNARWP